MLVRHGESRAQEQHIVGGHAGCLGLSERGRAQARALARRLAASGELAGASALYTSLMPRAIETAAILVEAVGGHRVVQDCDFCEHHPGEGDGLSYEEFDRRWPAPDPELWSADLRRDPGGETWTEMATRVARGLDGVLARHPGETVVVVCHGGVVVHSLVRWLGLEPGWHAGRAWLDPVNTSLTEWRFGGDRFLLGTVGVELVRFNDHSHLLGATGSPDR